MDTVLETGTVMLLERRDGKQVALVAMDVTEEGQERCATCRMCARENDDSLLLAVQLEDDSDIPQGARVEVEVTKPSLYLPILVTLVVPLVGMTLGGILGTVFGAGSEWKDLLAVGLAFVFGAALFAGGYALFRKHFKTGAACAKVRRLL